MNVYKNPVTIFMTGFGLIKKPYFLFIQIYFSFFRKKFYRWHLDLV
ncbi:MAG: hypothetical protein PWP52_208 [Bacteroidales bacterium]|nr:hypothetical protein [Bacteroidales bacterium]